MKNHSSKLIFLSIVTFITLFIFLQLDTFKSNRLVVGANKWVGYESLFLYSDFNKKKTRVFKIVELPNSTKVIQAFKNDLIDVAAITLDEALILSQSIDDLVIFLAMDVSAGGDAIITLDKKLGIRNLENHKVGVEIGAVGSYLISRAIDIHKLDAQKIKVLPVPHDAHEKSLLEGQVDFVVTFNPTKYSLIKAGGHVVFDSNSIPGEIVDVLVTKRSLLKKHQPDFIDFTIELQKYMELISLRNKEVLEFISRRIHLPIQSIEQHLRDIQIPIGKENVAVLRKILEVNIGKLEKVVQRSYQYQEIKSSRLEVEFDVINESFKMGSRQ